MDERQIAQLETIKNKVRGILGGDPSGHADDHVERVAFLAERFASNYGDDGYRCRRNDRAIHYSAIWD